MKKKKFNSKRLTIKLMLCSIYLIIITILLVGSYRMFSKNKIIKKWDEVSSTEEYSYMEISRMSEKFAYYENENIGLHFVIEEEDTKQWHTYVIAIDESNYNDYKALIDYSYNRTDKKPDKVVVYGYPSIMNDELKQIILKNISNFLPNQNELNITKDNLENYLTNSYLDTTIAHNEGFDFILFITLLLLFIMIALLIFTIFDRDKIVDNIEKKTKDTSKKKVKVKN